MFEEVNGGMGWQGDAGEAVKLFPSHCQHEKTDNNLHHHYIKSQLIWSQLNNHHHSQPVFSDDPPAKHLAEGEQKAECVLPETQPIQLGWKFLDELFLKEKGRRVGIEKTKVAWLYKLSN